MTDGNRWTSARTTVESEEAISLDGPVATLQQDVFELHGRMKEVSDRVASGGTVAQFEKRLAQAERLAVNSDFALGNLRCDVARAIELAQSVGVERNQLHAQLMGLLLDGPQIWDRINDLQRMVDCHYDTLSSVVKKQKGQITYLKGVIARIAPKKKAVKKKGAKASRKPRK